MTGYLVVTAIGWFGNGCIIVATIVSRRLHGPCNVLIAVEAFCEILHQSAHVIMAYFMFTEQYLIPAERCFHFQLIPSFGMNVGTFLNLSIGIDRIFSIIFPFL
ncbi:unnamed protein product [Gongylonema pulchrum]|uniref:G_PROTEIN_RECEP_F1_2 domain-containing protein n=1 Tax=Gongylonema pulchrum TaxID=637853 RepID=A0A183DR23_9BILA|nr:unnamed protein product [Gongylonema pulchrum]